MPNRGSSHRSAFLISHQISTESIPGAFSIVPTNRQRLILVREPTAPRLDCTRDGGGNGTCRRPLTFTGFSATLNWITISAKQNAVRRPRLFPRRSALSHVFASSCITAAPPGMRACGPARSEGTGEQPVLFMLGRLISSAAPLRRPPRSDAPAHRDRPLVSLDQPPAPAVAAAVRSAPAW